MENNSNTLSHDEIFVEKHNGFLKDGKPDDEYCQAKEGLYQYRIASVHYKTEKEARDKLQQILDNQIKAQKYDTYSQLLESIVRINSDCKTLDEFIQKYQLPKLLVTVSQNGEPKIEKLETIQNSRTNAEIVNRLKNHFENLKIYKDTLQYSPNTEKDNLFTVDEIIKQLGSILEKQA